MYVFVYVCVYVCESETPVRDRQQEKQTAGIRWPGFFFSMGKVRERERETEKARQ
jgi:hypothetical protein